MQFLRPLAFLTLLIVFTLLTACGGQPDAQNPSAANVSTSNSRTAATNKANTNAEELGMVINFAWDTEDLAWKKDDANKTLTAAFRLTSEDAKKLTEQLSARSPGVPKVVSVEEWFPAELVAQGESGSGDAVVDSTAYPADQLYQSPFEKGTISRVNGTDFFVIELHGK